MKLLIGLTLICSLAQASLKATGALKVFKGPEGERITLIEVNDSKEILVQYTNTGAEQDGKTKLFLLEGKPDDRTVFYNVKRGSKTERFVVMRYRDKKWTFYHPEKSGFSFDLAYSEEESKKTTAKDFLNSYAP